MATIGDLFYQLQQDHAFLMQFLANPDQALSTFNLTPQQRTVLVQQRGAIRSVLESAGARPGGDTKAISLLSSVTAAGQSVPQPRAVAESVAPRRDVHEGGPEPEPEPPTPTPTPTPLPFPLDPGWPPAPPPTPPIIPNILPPPVNDYHITVKVWPLGTRSAELTSGPTDEAGLNDLAQKARTTQGDARLQNLSQLMEKL
jgi:hypothetical protein